MGAALVASTAEEQRRKRAQQRRRQAGRYALEIETARARNMPDTAAAIEAERDEWLASADNG